LKKETTIYDIAKTLNISATTVSRGLQKHDTISLKTQKRIADTAKELGYRSNNFASNLRKQKTNTIGIMLHELHSSFISSVLAGIEKITAEANYDLIIGHSSESYKKEAANAHNFFHKRVDGLIAALAFDTEDMSHFDPFFNRNIPVVFFDRVEETSKGTKVIIDNVKAGYDATQHLIDQGCKRIVHITSNMNRNVYELRFEGFLNALKHNSLPFDDSMLFITELTKDMRKVVSLSPLPDGIFATNDLIGAIAIQVLKENNLSVPDDIAIVGFNNDILSIITDPKLTTINYPGYELGEIAAQKLIAQLEGKEDASENQTIIIKSELICRESSMKKSLKLA
jgi:LacI family transcriptional regulator